VPQHGVVNRGARELGSVLAAQNPVVQALSLEAV